MDEDRYLRLNELVAYSGLSRRALTRYLADATHPLPAHRLGRVVLVKRSEFDRWLVEEEQGSSSREVSGKGLSRERRAALEMAGYTVTE